MHVIHTSSSNLPLDVRPSGNHVRECFVDDDLEVSASPPITAITLIDGPAGTPPTITPALIVTHEIGKHLFRVEFSDGASVHLHVMSFEASCLDKIQDAGYVHPSIAVTRVEPRTRSAKLLILRSLAQHASWFDGTAASMECQSLAPYGGG